MNDQRALDDQLDDLEKICAERGLYDAQDWLKNTRSSQRAQSETLKRVQPATVHYPESDAAEQTLAALRLQKATPKRGSRKANQKQLLEEWKRKALVVMDSYTDDFPLGHYFMWAIVNVGGKRKYRICIGSGRSSRMEDARAAVAAMPGVDHAWYNLD